MPITIKFKDGKRDRQNRFASYLSATISSRTDSSLDTSECQVTIVEGQEKAFSEYLDSYKTDIENYAEVSAALLTPKPTLADDLSPAPSMLHALHNTESRPASVQPPSKVAVSEMPDPKDLDLQAEVTPTDEKPAQEAKQASERESASLSNAGNGQTPPRSRSPSGSIQIGVGQFEIQHVDEQRQMEAEAAPPNVDALLKDDDYKQAAEKLLKFCVKHTDDVLPHLFTSINDRLKQPPPEPLFAKPGDLKTFINKKIIPYLKGNTKNMSPTEIKRARGILGDLDIHCDHLDAHHNLKGKKWDGIRSKDEDAAILLGLTKAVRDSMESPTLTAGAAPAHIDLTLPRSTDPSSVDDNSLGLTDDGSRSSRSSVEQKRAADKPGDLAVDLLQPLSLPAHARQRSPSVSPLGSPLGSQGSSLSASLGNSGFSTPSEDTTGQKRGKLDPQALQAGLASAAAEQKHDFDTPDTPPHTGDKKVRKDNPAHAALASPQPMMLPLASQKSQSLAERAAAEFTKQWKEKAAAFIDSFKPATPPSGVDTKVAADVPDIKPPSTSQPHIYSIGYKDRGDITFKADPQSQSIAVSGSCQLPKTEEAEARQKVMSAQIDLFLAGLKAHAGKGKTVTFSQPMQPLEAVKMLVEKLNSKDYNEDSKAFPTVIIKEPMLDAVKKLAKGNDQTQPNADAQAFLDRAGVSTPTDTLEMLR